MIDIDGHDRPLPCPNCQRPDYSCICRATLPAAPAPTEQAEQDETLRFREFVVGCHPGVMIQPWDAWKARAALAARQAPTEAPKEAHPLIDSPKLLDIFRAFREAWSHKEMQVAEQRIRDYIARQAPDSRDVALEEAATLCDAQALEPECPERATYCADAIRALKGPAQ